MVRLLLLLFVVLLSGCSLGPPVVVESYRVAGDYVSGTVRNESGKTLHDLTLQFEGTPFEAEVGTVADGVSVAFRAITFESQRVEDVRPVRATWSTGSADLR